MPPDHQQPCDLIIHARYLVPIQPKGCVLEDQCVVVAKGAIVAILPPAQARAHWRPDRYIHRPDGVVLPGLVNAHTHNPMTLMRGLADDLPLMTWLRAHIWPVETRIMSADFVADGTALAVLEMLRGGTTCANENYFFGAAQARVYSQLGFRAVVGAIVIDFPTAAATDDAAYFARAEELYQQWQRDPLIHVAIAPHAPYTVNDANLRRVGALSERYGLTVHMHMHETAQEVADGLAASGERPLARLDRLGLVNERLLAVHMTQLTDEEIALCAQRQVSVVHCPESNLKLASGFCPVARLQQAGVRLALGTDGCASNNDLDMFGEMRTAALLAKGVAADPTVFDAPTALHAATLGGAQAIGLGGLIGSIEVGKQADLICVNLNVAEAQPLHNILSHLVYSASRHHVNDVWIAGRQKVADGVIVDCDQDRIVDRARQWGVRVQQARQAAAREGTAPH